MSLKHNPRYVVYHIKSTMAVNRYYREADAKRRTTKENNAQGGPACFAYTDIKTYNTKVVHMVERTHLMTGKKFLEPSNTPEYLSPASEAYWSA